MDNTDFNAQIIEEQDHIHIDSDKKNKAILDQKEPVDNSSTGSFEVINEHEYDFEMKKSLQMYQNIELEEFKTEDGEVYYLPTLKSLQALGDKKKDLNLSQLQSNLE